MVEDFVVLTEETLLVTSLARTESTYSCLKIIRLRDGALLYVLPLPFSKAVDNPGFFGDSFHLNGGGIMGTPPFVYNPGHDRIIVLTTDSDHIHAEFTVVISVK